MKIGWAGKNFIQYLEYSKLPIGWGGGRRGKEEEEKEEN